MLDAGVAEHDPDVRECERHQLVGERAAVELEGVAGGAEEVDELVHDAATHPGELVLGCLSDAGERDAVEPEHKLLVEREGDSGSDRRGRGHAGPERDVAAEGAVEARDLEASGADLGDDAEHVVGPAAIGRQQRRRSALVRLVEIDGEQAVAEPAVGCDRERDRTVDGRGEHEPLVVVGVLADQVDAAGRADDERLGAEGGAEPGADVGQRRSRLLPVRQEENRAGRQHHRAPPQVGPQVSEHGRARGRRDEVADPASQHQEPHRQQQQADEVPDRLHPR